jgi:hypothetical protein
MVCFASDEAAHVIEIEYAKAILSGPANILVWQIFHELDYWHKVFYRLAENKSLAREYGRHVRATLRYLERSKECGKGMPLSLSYRKH